MALQAAATQQRWDSLHGGGKSVKTHAVGKTTIRDSQKADIIAGHLVAAMSGEPISVSRWKNRKHEIFWCHFRIVSNTHRTSFVRSDAKTDISFRVLAQRCETFWNTIKSIADRAHGELHLTDIRPQFLWPIRFHGNEVARDVKCYQAQLFEDYGRRNIPSKGGNKGCKRGGSTAGQTVAQAGHRRAESVGRVKGWNRQGRQVLGNALCRPWRPWRHGGFGSKTRFRLVFVHFDDKTTRFRRQRTQIPNQSFFFRVERT